MASNMQPQKYQFAILRIGIALTILAKVVSERNYLDLLYSSDGLLQRVVSNTTHLSYTLSLQSMLDAFHIQNEHALLVLLYSTYAVAAICLLVGFLTRVSAIICFAIHMIMFNGYDLLAFGFDSFLLTLLFYTVIFPVGECLSVDRLLFKSMRQVSDGQAMFYLRILQVHLCIVYFVAGVSKLRGHEWIDGGAIWSAINQPQFFTPYTPMVKSVVSQPGISALLSYSTLLLEIGFPLGIFLKKFQLNRVFLMGILGMHAFIGIVMGLQLFAFVMIVFDLSAFGYIIVPWVRALSLRWIRFSSPADVYHVGEVG
jgi:Vitamin K-dependent gamma-carboxylase